MGDASLSDEASFKGENGATLASLWRLLHASRARNLRDASGFRLVETDCAVGLGDRYRIHQTLSG